MHCWRWSLGTLLAVDVSHRHSACRTWKWHSSCRAPGHTSLRARFSAMLLSLMKALGACGQKWHCHKGKLALWWSRKQMMHTCRNSFSQGNHNKGGLRDEALALLHCLSDSKCCHLSTRLLLQAIIKSNTKLTMTWEPQSCSEWHCRHNCTYSTSSSAKVYNKTQCSPLTHGINATTMREVCQQGIRL